MTKEFLEFIRDMDIPIYIDGYHYYILNVDLPVIRVRRNKNPGAYPYPIKWIDLLNVRELTCVQGDKLWQSNLVRLCWS